MSRRSKDIETPGTDSFLDVVANLVGILIILVVVIGAGAASSWAQPGETEQQQSQRELAEKELAVVSKEALNYERNNREIRTKIDTEKAMISAKKQMRHQLLMQKEIARQKIESERSKLNRDRQRQLELEEKRRQLSKRQRQLESGIQSIRVSQPKLETIEHFPTPVAQTVFNQEYHFQLKKGRITLVPIDELVELVKGELQVKAEKLKNNQSSSTIETVGPVGNFRMQYLLNAKNVAIPSAGGMIKQRTVQFQQFILLPILDDAGTRHQAAIQPGGELHDLIKRLDPSKTTISLWVYPDSYSEFREVKQWLQQRGFQIAVWPLPERAPISGGPNGFRSASQ